MYWHYLIESIHRCIQYLTILLYLAFPDVIRSLNMQSSQYRLKLAIPTKSCDFIMQLGDHHECRCLVIDLAWTYLLFKCFHDLQCIAERVRMIAQVGDCMMLQRWCGRSFLKHI